MLFNKYSTYFLNYFKETKRAYINPTKVEDLLVLFWDNGKIIKENMDTIHVIKERVKIQLNNLRKDHKRVLNPTPYKVPLYFLFFLNHKFIITLNRFV